MCGENWLAINVTYFFPELEGWLEVSVRKGGGGGWGAAWFGYIHFQGVLHDFFAKGGGMFLK